MGFNKLVNTRYFSEAAIDFKRNGGRYTLAPIGSREYKEYWDLQTERCRMGYQVGDLWIPGRHYFYLNFTPILKVPDSMLRKAWAEQSDRRGKVNRAQIDKILDFPRFWEIDYEWFNYKYIARNGGEFQGISSPGGQHICCAKARGAGFSYKEASDGVYNYNFIPFSKSYYFASLEQYLTTDGILNKVQGMLDFINDHCHEWYKNRMKKNTLMHQKASFIDDWGREKGYMSEIIGQTIDDPNKARGKRGAKITYEEGGSFKRLKESLAISVGSIKDGGFTVGQISVFGTGGEEGPSIEGLEDVFTDPRAYDMIAFNNIWDEGMEHTECGYFVPTTKVNVMFMDDEGNVDLEGALNYEMSQREMKAKAKDPKELDRRKAEYPIHTYEVFSRMNLNIFPVDEIDKQIRKVESNSAIQSLIRFGKMIRGDKGPEFMIQTRDVAKPILQYPHKRSDDLSGCVTIYERPFIDQSGKTPAELYTLVFDSYYREEAEDTTSLMAAYIIKQYNNIHPVSQGLPVASWVGRPQSLEIAYEQMFLLADYYNAMIQGEIAGGGQGIVDYARKTRQLHKIKYEPEMLHNKEIASRNRNRSYLMNMTADRKKLGLTYLADWLKEQRGISEDLTPTYNLDYIYDLGLLREMRKFDGVKNADRISAMIIAMFELKEHVARQVNIRKKEATFFRDRVLFNGSGGGNLGVTQSW